MVFIQQELEFVLQALDELIKGHLVLVVGQPGQLLHRAVSFVTLEHDGVQELRHHKEVVDLFPQDFLERKTFFDLKLATFSCSRCLRGVAFTLRSDLEKPQLLEELLFDLSELVDEEAFLFGAVGCCVVLLLSLLVLIVVEGVGLVKVSHCEGIGVPFKVCCLSLATRCHMLLVLLLHLNELCLHGTVTLHQVGIAGSKHVDL